MDYINLYLAILSTITLIVSISVYIKDNKINLKVSGGLYKIFLDDNQIWLVLDIINLGKNPVFINRAGIDLGGGNNIYLKNVSGRRVISGDSYTIIETDTDNLKRINKESSIRVWAEDKTGKKYFGHIANR